MINLYTMKPSGWAAVYNNARPGCMQTMSIIIIVRPRTQSVTGPSSAKFHRSIELDLGFSDFSIEVTHVLIVLAFLE